MEIRFSAIPVGIPPSDVSLFLPIIGAALQVNAAILRFGLSLSNPVHLETLEEQVSRFQGKIHSGGQSTVFALRFNVPSNTTTFILKVFKQVHPTSIANHIASVNLFTQEFADGIQAKGEHYSVKTSKNILISQIEETGGGLLIQEYAFGEIPDFRVPLSSICKAIAYRGYVIDPYPRNWRRTLIHDKKTLEYIDILMSNSLNLVRESVERLRESLKVFEYAETI